MVRIRQDDSAPRRWGKAARCAVDKVNASAAPAARTGSAEIRDRWDDANEHAVEWAGPRLEKVERRIERGREVARPKVEAGWEWVAPRAEAGRDWAAPRVEAAAATVAPAVERARERILADLVPRLAEAAAAAASAGAAAAHSAGEVAGDRLQTVAERLEEVAPAKPKRRKRKLLLLVLAAAGAAGLAAWRRKPAEDDDWHVPATGVSHRTASSAAIDTSTTAGAASAEAATQANARNQPGEAAGEPAAEAGSGSFGDAAATTPSVEEGGEANPEAIGPVDGEGDAFAGGATEAEATADPQTKPVRTRTRKPAAREGGSEGEQSD